ncbi:ABC-type transport auxiliary lipoprotein family protein [Solilutibacter silvestris]|uniref:ABC-type putative transport system protein n=1 Tax=Solilutibacter silvestris TaxID=1645665 RepID=A0A2K1Q2H1_9GAMM|nr:ABC-type transport auxiliary lipoprotein family protein [Lysobacter silvestris]PNS09235.1 ABC-type putative transport system protein [Lysobacter silvestris]
MKSIRMKRLRFLSAIAALAMLGGCSILPKQQDMTIHSALSHVAPEPSWPQVRTQLVIARPTAERMLADPRIVVRPTPGELQVYHGAVWAEPPPEMVQRSVLQVLEDSGRLKGVAVRGGDINGDFNLAMDIRRFDSDYAGGATPNAVVEIAARVVSNDGSVIAYRLFHAEAPASSAAVPAVAQAFQQALAKDSADIAGWALGAMANRR